MTGTTAGYGRPASLAGANAARSEWIASTCALGDPLADTVAADLRDRGRITRARAFLAGEPQLVRSPRERILRSIRAVHGRARKDPEAFAA